MKSNARFRVDIRMAWLMAVAAAGVLWAADHKSQSQSHLLAQAGSRAASRPSTVADAPAQLSKASDLLGATVKNRQGETLGQIEDLAINLGEGRVAYVVLSTGGVLGIAKKVVAVPLTAFVRGDDESTLLLQADQAGIDRAVGISENAWPALDDPYFEAVPFWQDPRKTDTPLQPQPSGDAEALPLDR